MNRYKWQNLGFIILVLLFFLPGPQNIFADMKKNGTANSQRECLDCHGRSNINTNEGVAASQAFCNECHLKEQTQRQIDGKKVSLRVPSDMFQGNPHKYIACIHCHTDVARSPHRSQVGVQCSSCHHAHSEAQAHAPHLRVRCEACHFKSEPVILNLNSDKVELAHQDGLKTPISLSKHQMTDSQDNQMCLKCHVAENTAGAPAIVLPAKSVLCIMCHNAPLQIGHGMFWIASLIGALGLVSMVFFWFKGSLGDENASFHQKISHSSEAIWTTIFSRRFKTIFKIFIFDIILQRRILQESVQRWSMHSLIYLAFLGRLCLSLFTVITYKVAPDSNLALSLIDKNNWFCASVNDLLGLFIVLGVTLAIIQRFVTKPRHVLSKEQDIIALIIIGLLVFSGFLAEGVRILVTQIPSDIAIYSFGGYLIAKVLAVSGSDFQSAYGYVWYAHAIIWAFFIAYLPFGKLKHILTTPLSLLLPQLGD